MMKTSFTIAALICAFASSTFANESEKERQEHVFKNFDRDGDGSVSLEEYKAGMAGNMAPERIATVFKQKDHNGDGKLTIEELFIAPPEPAKTEKKDDKKSAPAKKDEKKSK